MKNRDGMVTSILKDQGDGWYFLTENSQDAAIQKVEDGKYWAEYDEADDRGTYTKSRSGTPEKTPGSTA